MTEHSMAWNQPGGDNGKKDPFNNKDPGADVEAFLNKLKASLNRVFGGGSGSGSGGKTRGCWRSSPGSCSILLL
jgi:membrane protease subunit HflK